MPFIRPEKRKLFADPIKNLIHSISTPGELNYVITSLVHNRLLFKGLNYTAVNEVIGVLECAKQELYRTVAAPYEDKKRLENGSVSELDNDSHERMR